MSFITVNGYQVPEEGTQEVEVPNYADAIATILVALLQNKSILTASTDVYIPDNGSLYYTASSVAIADGDYKYEQEVGTGDLVSYIRRSSVWVEYDRTNEDSGRIVKSLIGKMGYTHIANAESDDSNIINSDTGGQNRIAASLIKQDVNSLAPGESSVGEAIVVSTQNSSGTADSTSLVQALALVVSGTTSAQSVGVNIRPGFTYALKINGSPAQSPLTGYVYDGVSVSNQTTAFTTPGTDVEIFTSDNDTILIGFSAPFSIIEADLDTVASQNIVAEYRYSTGNDTWAPLTINSDGTNGFSSSSGQITFIAPGGWATSNLYQGSSVTAGYYIEIKRTRNGLSTPPIESEFKVFEDGGSDMFIHGNGCVEPTTLADSFALNNCIYYSSDQSALAYKDKAGVVFTFNMTVA